MLIDLHTHSTASDGTEPPERVVRAAREAGLDVVALTDHDTTRGWSAAEQAANEVGIGLVRGVEISCRTDDGISVHLLGYLVDPTAPGLLGELEKARESRVTRAERMVALLGEDFPITWDHVQEQVVPGATVGRPHIADALVRAGVVRDRSEAFVDLLHRDSRYHVRHYAPGVVHAVRLVREAGGVPVVAHPFAPMRGRVIEDDVVEAMAAAGLAGLELEHRDMAADARERAARLAAGLGLLTTGSSDYHGTGKPNRLGENTTRPEVLERIEAMSTSGVAVVRP